MPESMMNIPWLTLSLALPLVGALACAQVGKPFLANLLGFCAIATATINVVGGFLVTNRMLAMFKKKEG